MHLNEVSRIKYKPRESAVSFFGGLCASTSQKRYTLRGLFRGKPVVEKFPHMVLGKARDPEEKEVIQILVMLPLAQVGGSCTT